MTKFNEILKPQNQSSYTGIEKRVPCDFGPDVSLFKDNNGWFRVVYSWDGVVVAGLVVSPYACTKGYMIEGVYTLPSYQRKGLAKQLLAVLRMTIGDVRHSENKTKDGHAWCNSVEGIK